MLHFIIRHVKGFSHISEIFNLKKSYYKIFASNKMGNFSIGLLCMLLEKDVTLSHHCQGSHNT